MPLRRDPPPRPQEVRHDLGYLRLELNDLHDLVRILSSRAERLTMSAGDALLDEIDDLRLVRRKERRLLELGTFAPAVRVMLGYHQAAVISLTDSVDSRSLTAEIIELLRPKTTWKPHGIFAQTVLLSTTSIVVYGFAAVRSLLSGPQSLHASLIFIGLIAFFLLFGIVFYRAGSGAVIAVDNTSPLLGVWRLLNTRPRSGPSPAAEDSSVSGKTIKRKPPVSDAVSIWFLGFLRLHLDDISDLLSLLKRNAKGVSIRAGRAIVSQPGDLLDATADELKALHVRSDRPRILIELGSTTARVSTFEQSAKALSLADDAARLLQERRTRVPVGRIARPLFTFWAITLALIPALALWLASDFSVDAVLASVVLVFSVVACVLFYRGALINGGATVSTKRRHERAQAIRELVLWAGGIVISSGVATLLTYLQLRGSE